MDDFDPTGLPLEELLAHTQALTGELDALRQQGSDTTQVEGRLYVIQQHLEGLEAKRQKERHDRVQALGNTLRTELSKRKGERSIVEQRWLEDIAQYNSQYDGKKAGELAARPFGSRTFVPLTRRICNIVEARLGDLLFPVDDRNWGVEASPVPELGRARQLAAKLPDDQPVGPDGQQVPATAVKQAIGEMLDEAKNAAANMQREIEDQLAQSNYASEARLVMHDAIKLGTGVMKGPSVYLRTRKKWVVKEDGTSSLEIVEDASPASVRVDPWLFFPETATKSMKANGSVFEGHPMSRAEFAALAKQPGFDKDAIRDELKGLPTDTPDSNERATQEAAGVSGVNVQKYMLWEYQGPVDTEDLEACGVKVPDDPLVTYTGVIWFTERGRVLKAIINVMETGELPYHVFNWQKDSASIWGYGLPYELRDMQEAANSSWRAAMDNMGLSVGGQLVVDTKAIQPQDTVWALTPNKVWRKVESGAKMEDCFKLFTVDSKVTELMAVFNMAKQLCDEIGGPMLAMQGQDAPSYMQTAQGMSIAYNAASIWMRRGVKLWDDDISVPMIGQYVDWNMQHNPKSEIKGDFSPIARGSSHLLEAEGQVQKLQMLAGLAGQMGIPIRKTINQLRAMARAMRLDDKELLPDDDEISRMEEAQKNAEPKLSPEQERIQIRKMELEDKDKERQFQLKVEGDRNQLRLAELAQKDGITTAQARDKYSLEMNKIEANLTDRREQRAHDAQALNAEITTRLQTGAGV